MDAKQQIQTFLETVDIEEATITAGIEETEPKDGYRNWRDTGERILLVKGKKKVIT